MKNDYYVYAHRRLDNNQIFYIGSGRGGRLTATSRRNSTWKEIVKVVGYKAEIICKDLTKNDSIELEDLTIQLIGMDTLSNKLLPCKVREMPYNYFSEYFTIDENSPSGLIWKNRKGSRVRANHVAGSKDKSGRWRVRLQGKLHQVSRVVYLLINGYISSELVIDHVDGNPDNNHATNLRAVSVEVNNRNISKQTRKDDDLPVGVRWDKQKQHFVAYVTDPSEQSANGMNKSIRKHFTLRQFKDHTNAYEAAKQAAIESRKQMLDELNNRLNLGYTTDHGT